MSTRQSICYCKQSKVRATSSFGQMAVTNVSLFYWTGLARSHMALTSFFNDIKNVRSSSSAMTIWLFQRRWRLQCTGLPFFFQSQAKGEQAAAGSQYGDHRAKLFQSPFSYSTFLVFISRTFDVVCRDEGISIKRLV